MKSSTFSRIIAFAIVFTLGFAITRVHAQSIKVDKKEYEALQSQLNAFIEEKAKEEKHLMTFDVLDYDVFSGREWARLHESHHENVIVNWPDGHRTFGIDRHISDLDFLFTFAPDTRIKTHPIRLGAGDFTAVMGIMEGTFTEPMKLQDGTAIQPTGKSFSIPMSTIGRWENGVMVEEYLFWDNKTYYEQIGL